MITVTIDAHSPTQKTQQELVSDALRHFDNITTSFIQQKVVEYNQANGTSFGDVYRCELYSRMVGYSHQAFCARVWVYNVAVWEAVRAYQQTATTIPTDAEFQVILDGVVF